MRQHARVLSLLATMALSIACYPDSISEVQQLSSVTTLVDSGPPLQGARTYSLPDTVIHSVRAVGADLIGHENDDRILARIRAGFATYGWREITDPVAERPDVVVLATVFEQTNTGVLYSDWWAQWTFWPGWPAYGPEWFWGVPTGAVEFTYETGTLALVMLDIRNGVESEKRVPALWIAAINGVVTQSAVEGALSGIDQAFTQSPYLRRE